MSEVIASIPDPDDPRAEDHTGEIPGTVESEDGIYCPHCAKKQKILYNVVGRQCCNRCQRDFFVKAIARVAFVSCVKSRFPWPYNT